MMSDVDVPSSGQPSLTASSRSEFSYRTHLVIYNFLRLVPSSLTATPTDEFDDPGAVESPAVFTPVSSHPVGSGHEEEEDENGSGDARGSGNAENGRPTDRQGMFDELRTVVAERNRRRDMATRELDQRALQTRRVLRELMEKVSERDLRMASPGDRAGPLPRAVTIVKKDSAMKFRGVGPISPPPAVEPVIVAGYASIGDGPMADSPFGNPLCSSTPSVTPQNVLTSPLPVESDDVATVDQMLGSPSSCNSAYIDIEVMDDIESLVNAGLVPSVSKPLKDEISLCWQSLERNKSSKLVYDSCLLFLFS